MSIHIHCNGTTIRCVRSEVLTVGMIGAPVQFTFSEEWDGLGKRAVFSCGEERREMLVGEHGMAVVPDDILTVPGLDVEVGVYAKRDDGTTWPAPTPMCKICTLENGTVPGEGATDPSVAEIWDQAINAVENIQEKVNSAEFKSELVAAVIAQLPVYDGEAVDA